LNMATRSSQTELIQDGDTTGVDAYMKKLKHPMKDVAEEIRKTILDTDKSVGEEIAWNVPSFFYTGKMKSFNPKEYKRFIVNFNFFKRDCLRLIFLRGTLVKSKLLEGDFKDGRKLIVFHDVKSVKANKKELQKIVKGLIAHIKKNG
jgi:hypothetical protein